MMHQQIDLTAVPNCPICDASERKFSFAGREHEYDNTTDLLFNFYRCERCTAVYPDPRPAESALPIIYPPNYYSRAQGTNSGPDALDLTTISGRVLHKMAIDRIKGNVEPHVILGPGKVYLDVGCGSGRHLKSIQMATGCRAEGIDFDIKDDLIAKYSQPPLILHRGDFLHYDFGDQKYDIVYAAHLIEHVGEPIAFLRKIDSLLKPGGICVLEVPNEDCADARLFGANWGGNHIPRHWFLPNPASAKIMVERASMSLRQIKFIPITFLIWSLHSIFVTHGFKKLGNALFPSDDRLVSTNPINLVRHTLARIISRIEMMITGKSACMIIIIGKQEP
jgi:2-polyprenyl-3-methyl-5-hydroxy-6-metoxy-1,4-benzoquinol methylase